MSDTKIINSAAKMMVMVGCEFACVKLVGRANYASSVDFKALVTSLRQRGYRFFVLELSECVLMDSTFLGGLAGFGLEMSKAPCAADGPAIEILNPNERITELLENLGVLHLFRCCDGVLAAPADAQTSSHDCSTPSRLELARASLEAHQVLMAVNPANVAKFKDVTQFLAEDLKKMEGPSGA